MDELMKAIKKLMGSIDMLNTTINTQNKLSTAHIEELRLLNEQLRQRQL